jgi:steroid delta-isomerase-like uncharacterized protein
MEAVMSTEEVKSLARRWYAEYVNGHSFAALDTLLTSDFVNHVLSGSPGNSRVELQAADTLLFNAFPDLHMTIEEMIADGNKVAVRFTSRGTHQADFMGIPATGKQLTSSGIDIFRCVDGKIAERWLEADFFSLLQQLGAIPT